MMVTGKKGPLCGCWLTVCLELLSLGCGNREPGTNQTREFVIMCVGATCTVERERASELLCSGVKFEIVMECSLDFR